MCGVVIGRHARLHQNEVKVAQHRGVDRFGTGGSERPRQRNAERCARQLEEQTPVFVELGHVEPLHDVVGHAEPAQVVARLDPRAFERDDIDAGAGRVLDHVRPNPREHAALHEERRSHADVILAPLNETRTCHRFVGSAHDVHGVAVERFACLGELDAAVSALEQNDAELLLEKIDLLNERRRRDVERACRFGEASRFCGFDERLNVARIHGVLLV